MTSSSDGRGRPLLVGELNPYRGEPEYALYPEPANSAGGRLCKRVLGISPAEYLRAFDRVNLCAGAWSWPAARARALEISNSSGGGRRVVLLGARVCAAFGVPYDPFTVKHHRGLGTLAVLPHPSGRCRAWNDPGAVGRAREVLAAYGVL